MGREKALLPFEGERLIDRVLRRLSAVADPVLFAPGTPGRLGPLPGAEVADASGAPGPLGALIAGLEATPHELVAVVAVDMPWCSVDVFRLAADLRSEEDAVVPRDGSGAQVLHAVYARTALPKLEAAADTRGLRANLAHLDVRFIDEPDWRAADPSGRFATNVNTPEELAASMQ